MQFNQLSFSYPKSDNLALDNISFEIPQGAIFALLGPNGAGKTTILRMITGVLKPDSGQVILDSDLLNSQSSIDATKYGVLIENPGVYPNMTIREYLKFFGYFYQVSNLESEISNYCKMLSLPINAKLKTLSLGMRQKVQLIRAIIHQPKLIMLDEPSANLDPESRQQIWKLILKIQAEKNSTFIICSHVLSEIESHATHLAFIKNGSLKAIGPRNEINKTKQHCIYQGRGLNRLKIFFEPYLKKIELVETSDEYFKIRSSKELLTKLNSEIIQSNSFNDEFYLSEMRIDEATLEEFYLEVMNK